MAEYKLTASIREGIGTNRAKKLRAEAVVPAVLYSKGEDNLVLQVEERELRKVYLKAGNTNIIQIDIDGDTKPAIFKDVQKHPFKNQYVHVDFQGIRMDELIRVNIPVIAEGRDDISVQPSVLMQTLSELEIECLPGVIPDEITIDVRDMNIGDAITVQDLDIMKDDRFTVLDDPETLVVTLQEPKDEVIEEEEEVEDVDAADVPTVDETEDDDSAEEESEEE
ncbi:MAG: 50S ribosomal protein L25 [Tissierellia bacterium]|nr:50S ribosomal protein L25 [Tissierellia bacterium]